MLSFLNCSNVGPFRGAQSSRNGLLQHGPQILQENLLLCGSSPCVTAPARCLLQHGLSMGCRFLQGMSTCSSVGSSTGCHVDICSGMFLYRLQGDTLCHNGLGLQGNLCTSAWITSSPSFSDLGACRANFFFCIFLTTLTPAVQLFLPFLKSVTIEAPPVSLLGSAVPCGRAVGAVWNQHRASSGSLHRGHPSSPPGHFLGMDTQYRNKKSKGNKL